MEDWAERGGGVLWYVFWSSRLERIRDDGSWLVVLDVGRKRARSLIIAKSRSDCPGFSYLLITVGRQSVLEISVSG